MTETSYIPSRRDHVQVVYPDARAKVSIALADTTVTVEEEYTLQDFTAIVATLGGSIGIFLGWSLLDLTKIIAVVIDKAFIKKTRTIVQNLSNK